MKSMETEQMENRQTNWEKLSISNDFLFGKVMQNPELCTELLQRILPDLEIDHIEYPELQKSIKPDIDAHSIRLDVYVKDEKEVVYDIEMQVSDTKELPKRSRYYQGMMDLQLIDKGQYYDDLNQSYIIFICPFDAFGKGRHIYTFENICKEDSRVLMGDGTVKIYLDKTEDPYVEKLEEAVKEAKKNREWRHEYMTLLMRDRENVKKGEEMLARLIVLLNEDNRISDIVRASQDEEYRKELYLEYHIV